ncbi:MAG: NAD(P)H-dependent glycerol-3-phosphate dehydrogenase [Thermobacillus sp.]|jgi:glycerol-3-phosphate dehydrogenase (NAD(P)+)|uniref:NAD(P)H-dependent glycerol-3-phosphate dehydrogenase n=1 Tax=Thermobacillus sp. TaxID=2108467 RepID=UPI000E365ECC|nr:NAD(P)H-dependent glycerol-3-phosphate dehydrogenase [Thermobacillus sp.]REJ13185.1 MAG: NAD(P)H-dependent glycerol-3-phosphate dehydrogenase [Paenibacillaceae bacterium]REK59183.1 MAG: NAD(P)H-dependent glycerol-3-phosphate dehydrogenase [Thermobacillus sp.]
MENKRAAVLVAGSWGTALATVLADNGCDVTVWTRRAEQADEINRHHTNSTYLPNVVLHERIRAVTDMAEALIGADIVVFAATSSSVREVARKAAGCIPQNAYVVHAVKGFERDTLKRISTILAEELARPESSIVVLSGPSHAEEVVRRCPTTVVAASMSKEAAEAVQDYFMNAYFRVYTNPDVIGVEVAGAIKNIIALGAGLSDGLGYGDNAKAALITRGLAEIGRLGQAMGAQLLTFAGLAGVGDLVVTCTSRHSRNWRAGSMLAGGMSLDEVLASMGMAVEGVGTTRAAYALSRRYGVPMPITEQLHAVLFEGKPPKAAVEALMGRVRTHESEEVAKAWLEAE